MKFSPIFSLRFIVILSISIFIIFACSDENAPTDLETNTYYAEYAAIYSNYDSLGNEATLEALNDYIVKYPERTDALIFKGYVLGKMGDYPAANVFFELAKQQDSLSAEIYEFQSAFMLYDTNSNEATRLMIDAGLLLDDSSSYLMNNLAWLNILEENYSEASEAIAKGLSYDSKNKYLYRTGYIAATLDNDSIKKKIFSEKLLAMQYAIPEELDSMLYNQGAFEVLKSLK